MVGFGGGEHLLWRAVNIDCCRSGVVSRALQEWQLTVTVAVTAAVHFLSACNTKSAASVFGDGSTVRQCLCMHGCVFAFVCHSLWLYVYKVVYENLRCFVCMWVSTINTAHTYVHAWVYVHFPVCVTDRVSGCTVEGCHCKVSVMWSWQRPEGVEFLFLQGLAAGRVREGRRRRGGGRDRWRRQGWKR